MERVERVLAWRITSCSFVLHTSTLCNKSTFLSPVLGLSILLDRCIGDVFAELVISSSWMMCSTISQSILVSAYWLYI